MVYIVYLKHKAWAIIFNDIIVTLLLLKKVVLNVGKK